MTHHRDHSLCSPLISVIIPAFNEQDRLGASLLRIITYLEGRGDNFELIVVDDGSDDDTVAVALSFRNRWAGLEVLRNDGNRGKGYSVRRGMLAARGKFLLFSDADLSTPIEEMEKLLHSVQSGECDVAIGSRGLRESRLEVRQPMFREAMGWVYNLIVQCLALRGIWDSQCGFKLFHREAARRIFTLGTANGFGFDVEVLYIARKLGYCINEVPVRWVNSPQSKVNPVRDSCIMFWDVVKVRLNDCFGRYRECV